MFVIWRSRTTEESSLKTFAGDRPPRYGIRRFSPRVGRGPVPRLVPPETANRIGFAHKFLAIRTELWDNYAYVNQYSVKNDAPEPNQKPFCCHCAPLRFPQLPPQSPARYDVAAGDSEGKPCHINE